MKSADSMQRSKIRYLTLSRLFQHVFDGVVFLCSGMVVIRVLRPRFWSPLFVFFILTRSLHSAFHSSFAFHILLFFFFYSFFKCMSCPAILHCPIVLNLHHFYNTACFQFTAFNSLLLIHCFQFIFFVLTYRLQSPLIHVF